MSYLESNKAVEDFATLAFKAKGSGKKFKDAWLENLDYKGVITQDVNEDDIVPLKIIGSIETAVKDDKVFNKFKPVFNIDAGSLVIEKTENDVGALGHTSLANKTVQHTVLEERAILPKAIYKLQQLDHMTFLKGGALVQWVLAELPKYVLQRISQAILRGGVKNEDGSDYKAIFPINGDELAYSSQLPNAYDGAALKEQLIQDIAKVDSASPVVFISPEAWAKLALSGDAWSVAMFTGNLDLGGELVRTPILSASGTLAEIPYIVVDTSSYLIGFSGSGIETLSDFEIRTNSEIIESRAYVAGSLMAPNRAVYTSVAAAAGGTGS